MGGCLGKSKLGRALNDRTRATREPSRVSQVRETQAVIETPDRVPCHRCGGSRVAGRLCSKCDKAPKKVPAILSLPSESKRCSVCKVKKGRLTAEGERLCEVCSGRYKRRSGPGGMQGRFRCGCGRSWSSRFAWADTKQCCAECASWVLPDRLTEPGPYRPNASAPHMSHLCQKCIDAGGDCRGTARAKSMPNLHFRATRDGEDEETFTSTLLTPEQMEFLQNLPACPT
ncbi:hypothetical protein AAG570_003436 [Ranatra chinensis]|uniref:GATA-type domain-containing protein n=1 Tax=Ranatra chinensis TaxID=642074 RepID=A0ABD0Y3N9_9HEMI